MARRRAPAPTSTPTLGVPPELLDAAHPLWSELDALAAHPVLGGYAYAVVDVWRVHPRRVRQRVRHCWMRDHELTVADLQALSSTTTND